MSVFQPNGHDRPIADIRLAGSERAEPSGNDICGTLGYGFFLASSFGSRSSSNASTK